MKEIDIEMPDGSIQTVEHPDNWTDEQVKTAIYKHFPQTKTRMSPTKSDDELTHEAAVRYGIKDPLVGLLNFGSRGAASVSNLAGSLINKLGGHAPKQEATDFSEMFGIPEEQKNLADKLIQFAPEAAISLSLPATRLGKVGEIIERLPAWGKYLKAGLGNALSQGALAASQSPENQGGAALEAGGIAAPFSALSEAIRSGSPTVRNIGRALGTLGAGGLGYYGAKSAGAPEPLADLAAVLGGALGGRGRNLERRVRENMLEGVKGTDYQDVLKAAERLGVHVRPSEASANPFTAGKEGGIGKSPQGAQELYEAGQKRLGQEESAIENLFGNIFPKSLKERKNALYEKANPQIIPDAVMSSFKENEIFKDALREVRNDKAYQQELKGIPENTIQYVNQVKRKMDTMRKTEKDSTKAGIIEDTINDTLNKLDEISPEYKQARQLAERGIVRREIEDLFNKKDETGENLFKTLLSNKRDYNNLQNKFKRLKETGSTPEQIENMKKAQQQLKDMKLVFDRLIPIPTAKTAAALGRENAKQEGEITGTFKKYLHQLLHSNKYDVAAVKLITNPKWSDELHKLGEITQKDKLVAAFHNLLGKVGGQAIAQ